VVHELPRVTHAVLPASGTQKPFKVSHALLQQPVLDVQEVKSVEHDVVPASTRHEPAAPAFDEHAAEQHWELKPQLPEFGRQPDGTAAHCEPLQ
jgi:hypothetical protein